MFTKTRTAWVTLVVVAISLAGCTAPGSEGSGQAELLVRQSADDSMVRLAVDKASGMTYDELLIMVDNQPWRFGPASDARESIFSVDGKDDASSQVMAGDVIRIPISGSAQIELRHLPTGESLQELDVFVKDTTAPSAVSLSAPSQGSVGVSRQVVFRWDAASDPSGATYEIEYWITNPPVSLPAEKRTGIEGTSYAVPKSEELIPAATYRWQVRAVDGMGNIGDWSDVWEFTTSA